MIDAALAYFVFALQYFADLTPGKFFEMYFPCLVLDTPRFVLSKLFLFLWEQIRACLCGIFHCPKPASLEQWPRVSVIIPGLNEEAGIIATIRSLQENAYPNLELIVIDDGSNDRTFEMCRPFSERNEIRLFRKNIPGGKTSAANFGLSVASGEIIVIVDSDTSFDRDALSNIIAPFANPRVGAVSGNIRVRNWRTSLLARYQAAEYLHCIFLGRRLHSAVGTLNIASGAFGAFRRDALHEIGGWDVGPGEDGDLTTKIRKLGYDVVFAPDAVCLTDAPTTLRGFVKQRLRWSRGVIRYRLRKHFNMLNPFAANFRLTNALLIVDAFFFRVLLPFLFPFYILSMIAFRLHLLPLVMIITWLVYAVLNLVQIPLVLYYSRRRAEDLRILPVTLIMTPFNILHRIVRLISMTQEIFFRSSYTDPYVPERVRDATIKW